jgi:hypothetical protein
VDELDATGTTVVKPKVADEEGVADFVDLTYLKVAFAEYTVGTRRIRFMPDGTNPYVVMHLIREVEDHAVGTNYTSIELYPTSTDARVVAGRRI